MNRYVFTRDHRDLRGILAGIALAGILVFLFVSLFFLVIQIRPVLHDVIQQLGLIQDQVMHLSDRTAARVTVTCYNSRVNQTDSTPRITAINTSCREGTVAVSRDLLEQGWTFGKKVWIEGHGVFVIEDVLAKSKVRQLDIWQPDNVRVFMHRKVLAVVLR